ncbi:MAG: efflux RND transporter permease subunit [Deltaproteobacteria bacterium]|nr:efflux RND transporter permease subunit [Deltaproteobacteria bacterium]
MIESLVAYSVAKRGWVLVLWALLAAGLLAIAVHLKLDALPDITSNQVQVLTRAPGLTPEEVEQRVTRPLEASFGGLPGLDNVRSLSRYGLSAITLVFDEDVDLLRARQLVAERMATSAGARASGVEPPELGPISGGLGEVFHFTVSAPTRTPSELLELVELRVAPVLKTVPGIVEVNTWGGAQRTMEVRADPNQLVARGVTLDELRVALTRTVGSQPGASLETGDHHILLRGTFLPRTPRDLGDAVVRFSQGAAVRVGDVATIAEGAAPRLGAASRNGRGETVYVMTQMLIGANARDVTRAVRLKMHDVRHVLPPDVQVDVVYDRSALVDATLRTVARSLAEGGLLVCLVLFLTLGSARAGVVVALTIPVAMLGATAAMTLLGVSGNLMSLGAVDFGLLVDGAVVLVEHVFHRASEDDETETPWADRVAQACSAVARPSFFGVFVILLVYVPVLSLTGVDGKLFRPMAITVVLALLVTLLFTLTFIPAAAAQFIRARDIPATSPRLVRWIERAHRFAIQRTVVRPVLVLGLSLAALGASIATLSRLGAELAPTLDEGALVIQTTRTADLGITGAIEQARRMELAVLAGTPEVADVVSRIGSPAIATDTMGLEQSDVFVALSPPERWRPGMTREKLLQQLMRRIEAATPHSEPAFTQPIQMRFNELLGGAPYDVVVSVLGQDLAALRTTVQHVRDTVAHIPGVADPRVLAEDEIPLLEVRPNSLAAGQRGMSAVDVLDVVGAMRLGLQVGVTYDGPREIPVTLRLGADAPHPLALAGALIPAPGALLVPLSEVATVRRQTAPAAMYRWNGERRMLLGFNVRGRELGDVVQEATARVAREVRLSEGSRLSWGGQYETLQDARRRLGFVIPAVLLLIGFVLFIHFGRPGPVLWVLAHVPFAAVGGVFALAARGMALSISAGIGFIALWGIAVMNGTVLVTEIDALERGGTDPSEATLAATRSRTRPVSMTALVAALGFLPMALAQGAGSEVQRPLATVVIGGLITSTTLTLLVLPTLRVAFTKLQARRKKTP